MKHLKTDYRETVHTIEITDTELNQILDGLKALESMEESVFYNDLLRVYWNS